MTHLNNVLTFHFNNHLNNNYYYFIFAEFCRFFPIFTHLQIIVSIMISKRYNLDIFFSSNHNKLYVDFIS